MSRRRIKENRIRRMEERGDFSDSIKKPTRFDNSHKPRADFLDVDDGREEYEVSAHMRRFMERDFEESLFLHDVISLIVHVVFVITLVVIGILKLQIFPVVIFAVLIIMLLIGFLLRKAPFYVPFGIALLALIIGVISNNINAVLIGIPMMYGVIILSRDL